MYKELIEVTATRQVHLTSDDPEQVWEEVLANDLDQIRSLCRAMEEELNENDKLFLMKVFGFILYLIVWKPKGHYINESNLLAKKTGIIPRSMMAALQRQYTLSHAACSVAAVWDEREGEMVCVRCLDWDATKALSDSSRIYKSQDKAGNEITIAGVTGMVGVLTGIKKGVGENNGFCISLNFVPLRFTARFKPDPTFLIRELLVNEEITGYHQALEKVQRWIVSSPCLITICGIEKNEATVVEFGPQGLKHERPANSGLLVQTNHFDQKGPLGRFKEDYYPVDDPEAMKYNSELSKNSPHRRRQIENTLKESPLASGNELDEQLKSIFETIPIMNNKTAYLAIMRPKSGSMKLWKCNEDQNSRRIGRM